jgi:hypothetical protein
MFLSSSLFLSLLSSPRLVLLGVLFPLPLSVDYAWAQLIYRNYIYGFSCGKHGKATPPGSLLDAKPY